MEPSRPMLAPDMPSNMINAEFFGSIEPSIPPHLRTPKQQDNAISKTLSQQEDPLPPHLRGMKPNSKMLRPAAIPNKSVTSSDSKVDLRSVNECNQPVLQPAPPPNALNKEDRRVASDQGSLKSSFDNLGVVKPTNEYDGKALQIGLKDLSVSKDTTASEQGDERNTAYLDAASSSNPVDIKETTSNPANPLLTSSLTSTFLDKWGSRGSTSFRKASHENDTQSEDLKNQLTFKAWPGQSTRSGPSAQIRTCHLKNLPSSATPAFVCSIVFGGALERVQVHRDLDTEKTTTTATVRFLSGDACKSFYDATANGLPFKPSGPASREMVAWVTLGREVDVIGGLLAQQIEQGTSRCVRAAYVDTRLEAFDLVTLATQKGRQLEGIEDGLTPLSGSRFVVWRFCDIADAVAFRGVLARDEDFESCNVNFSEDPCAVREVPDL